MNPLQFFKCLSDDTRLSAVLLISKVEEACVCDLMGALDLDQPKTSRHLAELRKCGVLLGERRGKWVYYRLHPELSAWAREVIYQTADQNQAYFSAALKKLEASQAQPSTC